MSTYTARLVGGPLAGQERDLVLGDPGPRIEIDGHHYARVGGTEDRGTYMFVRR